MATYTVTAELAFTSSNDGGLSASMSSPTPSLLLLFTKLGNEPKADEADLQLGAVIDVGEPAIRPGSTFRATLAFWSDLGRIYARPGTTFGVWYAGRIVGKGVVLNEFAE